LIFCLAPPQFLLRLHLKGIRGPDKKQRENGEYQIIPHIVILAKKTESVNKIFGGKAKHNPSEFSENLI
jgi:hypothetical protein